MSSSRTLKSLSTPLKLSLAASLVLGLLGSASATNALTLQPAATGEVMTVRDGLKVWDGLTSYNGTTLRRGLTVTGTINLGNGNKPLTIDTDTWNIRDKGNGAVASQFRRVSSKNTPLTLSTRGVNGGNIVLKTAQSADKVRIMNGDLLVDNNATVTGDLTVSGTLSGATINATHLGGALAGSYLRSDADTSFSGENTLEVEEGATLSLQGTTTLDGSVTGRYADDENFYLESTDSDGNSGTALFTLKNDAADVTAASTLLHLVGRDNGDADLTFFQVTDNDEDSLFTIGQDGDTWTNGDLTVDGEVTFGSNAGSDLSLGNSTGAVTITSDDVNFALTDATDNVLQMTNATNSRTYLDVDTGASDAVTLGNSTDTTNVTGGTVNLTGGLVRVGTGSTFDTANGADDLGVEADLEVDGATDLDGTLAVAGAATLSSTLGVTGNTTLGGTLGVTGATTLSSTLAVTGNTTVGGTLGVTGAATLSDNLSVSGTATVTGATTLNGGLTMDSGAFAVADTSGNISGTGTYTVTGVHNLAATGVATTVLGTLNVDEATTLDTTLGVTGLATLSAGALIVDDQSLTLGTDSDATLMYDEATDNRVELAGADLYIDQGLTVNGAFTPSSITLTDGNSLTLGTDNDVTLTWDNTAQALEVNGGLVTIGEDPGADTATGDGDLFVEDALEVDGATDLDGTLSVAGNTTLGDAATDTVTVTADVASDLIPSDGTASTQDLGASTDATTRWNALYVSTIDVATAITDDTSDATLTISGATTLGANALTRVGTGSTFDTANGADDLGVEADLEVDGVLDADGQFTLGDNGETGAIDTSDWDISATGAITGASFDANGTGNSLSNVDNADLTNDTIDYDKISDTPALDATTTLGIGAFTYALNLDDAASAFEVQDGGAPVLSVSAAGAVTVDTTTTAALTLDTGSTGTINIGTDTDAEAVNLATGAGAKTLTLGSTNTTSATTLQSGTGGLTLTTTSTTADAIDLSADGTVAGTAINLETTDGGIELTAAGAANGDITLTVADDFLNTVSGDYTVDATGVVLVDTDGAATLSGQTVAVTSDGGDVTLTGSDQVVISTADDGADDVDITGSVTVSSELTVGGVVSADGLAVTVHNSGTDIASSVDLSAADVAAASMFHVNTNGGAVELQLEDVTAEVGRTYTFVIDDNDGSALTVVAGNDATNDPTVTTIVGAGAAVDAIGDMIQCTVFSAQEVTCLTYAQ